MEPTSTAPHPWTDIHLETEPFQTLCYRSDLVVCEESLIRGQWVGRAWNGAGYINPWESVRLDPTTHPTPQAFWVEVDGQLLASHWEWAGFEKQEEETGLHAVLTLRHSLRPVTIQVHTLLDGTPVLTRWLSIANTGSRPAALSAAFPWSGLLQTTPRWRAHLPEGQPLYEVGYMANTRWGDEGHFQWQPLPNAGYRIDGRYRRDRHRHPFFVLRNNATGEHFVCQLAWSGGYSFEFDLDADLGKHNGEARLAFRLGPDGPAPLCLIDPGETVHTPEVHLGLVFGDLDTAVQAMHDHLRQSVFSPQPRGRGGWVEGGLGPEVEITVDYVEHQIKAAADLGIEVFFIDASWYAPPRGNWWSTVGDWQVDLDRFPGGLKPFRDRVHELGMLFGLWMDAERLGAESKAFKEHPDWVAMAYDGQQRLGSMIDLSHPAAAQWLEEQISRVIGDNELEFFRLDYNVGNLGPGAQVVRGGYVENSYWRYYEALYEIYERVRRRFPEVILENCASGGARTDLGMVRRFSHTWVTDWQIAPRAFTITNGMTMALPPEYVDRLLSGQNGHLAADLDFQARLLLFVRPTISIIHPLSAAPNPVQLARVRHMVDLYKNFVRPFMSQGRIYHHTPAFGDLEPQGWGVLELASREQDRAIAGLFQLSAPQDPEYLFRPRGLDPSRRYRVRWDNHGYRIEVEGHVLANEGLRVRLAGPLTSELLLFEAL